MKRQYFLQTERTGFGRWEESDLNLAKKLWGNPQVTKYICAKGVFTEDEIEKRLHTEIENGKLYGIQYWPVFHLQSGELVGCCGLRPHGEDVYEIGFHLCPEFWGDGYAVETATAVIQYAFGTLLAKQLFAGHNPKNIKSQKVLRKLGFQHIGDEFYEPTGLIHPSYILKNESEV